MAKFAISKHKSKAQSSIDPSVTKAVANSTPLIHALAEKIKSYHDPEDGLDSGLSNTEEEIQALFNIWPADETSKRLAQLTAVLTDFTPTLSNTSPKVGQLFKLGGVVYVIVYVYGNQVYGVNASATYYASITGSSTSGLLLPGNENYVSKAEYGLFTKALLGTSGSKFLSYVAANISGAVPQLLAAVGTDVL